MKPAEITWSLMHPVPLDADYMRRIAELAKNSDVDSFEICGECHTPDGGLDGLCLFGGKPEDHPRILQNRETLRKILEIAHSIGRKVIYWHREVTVRREVLELNPGLLDENGEFDLLGEAYRSFLERKLTEAFAAVPELDGIVLTLTEADFSAIHNSSPDRYPPELVVERISGIFAQVCERLGKRFVLRSFGSIRQDYEDILQGARLAARRHAFEIETKITPYDFDPFLPENPFLTPVENLPFSAECDSLGEFLGAGFLPAENVENIVKYVNYALRRGVSRFAIRVDRVGNSIFDLYPVNLFAYTQAIRHPELSADDILKLYAKQNYPPEAADRLILLGKLGLEAIEKICYIDGSLIFHQFPPQSDLKWLKAGGFFTMFAPKGTSFAECSGIWSVLTDHHAVGTALILSEKREGAELVKKGLALLEELRPLIPPERHAVLSRLWNNLKTASDAISMLCRVTASYFEDMANRRHEPETLLRELAALPPETVPAAAAFCNGMGHDSHEHENLLPIEKIYSRPLAGMAHLLLEEYRAETAVRERLEPGAELVIVPGSITDDWRCIRNMHASHAFLKDGKLGRFVGNPVFPNGFVKIAFPESGHVTLECDGIPSVSVNGAKPFAAKEFDVPADSTVVFRKFGKEYPVLYAVILK